MRIEALDRLECRNLLTLYMLMSGKSKETVAIECQDLGWGQFKPLLTAATIEHLRPIQAKYHEVMSDKTYLESVLRDGRDRAALIADRTLAEVKAALGFSVLRG